MNLEQMLLANMTQPQAEAALARGTAILVTGSVEQHGGHLPLGTDAFAALTIALRVGQRLEAPVLPLSPVGVAPYHMHWAGSLTISPDTLAALMLDVCSGLSAAGVERVVVVNWHEGNTSAIRIAADRIQAKLPVRVIVAESHIITNGLFPDEMEFTHAGAMETAAVLAHDSSLVRLDELVAGDQLDRGTDGHALFRRRDVFPVMKDFREVASAGWYGRPDTITEERAREIIDAVADHIVGLVEDVWKGLTERMPDGEDTGTK
ncbi:MAG TPA: creatininase family protein [Acidimicrobiia bacterium]|jgi:creatinine amidohydrolase|nr:creatininase family protein [Acidimicrobiia bacterium]